MENSSKRTNTLLFVCLLLIAIGCISGYYYNGTNPFELQYYAPYSKDSISTITDNVIPLCRSQMLQFVLIFASSFSVFIYPVICSAVLYRAFSIGVGLSSILNSGNYSGQALSFLISYILITAVIVIFAINASTTLKRTYAERSIENKLLIAFRCFVLFLMTSGTALIIRLIPLIIFS